MKKCVDIDFRDFINFYKKCFITAKEMFTFLPLKNNSVTTELSILLLSISAYIS